MKNKKLSQATSISTLGAAAAAGAALCTAFGSGLPSGLAAAYAVLSGVLLMAGYALHVRTRHMKSETALVDTEMVGEQLALNDHCIVSHTDENHVLTHVNRKLLELTGYSREELIGKPAGFLYQKSNEQVYLTVRSLLESGKKWSGETALKCKDGSTRWTHATVAPIVDRHGKLRGAVSVRTDLTDTRVATTQREMSIALHQDSEPLFVLETGSFRILYMNEAAMQHMGWAHEEYGVKSIAEVELEGGPDTLVSMANGLQDSGDHRAEARVRMRGIPYEVSLQLVRPYRGPSRFVAVFRDVQEKIDLERAKDEFISTVSHELRSPLTSIKGAMGLLLSGVAGELPGKAHSMIEIAYRNADQLVLIVNDILDLEKLSANRMELDLSRNDLAELAREAVALNRVGAERFDVSMLVEGDEVKVPADFDYPRMLQVMTNLLSNAAKFSNAGGKVIVSVHSRPDGQELRVRDQGAGIPKEAIANIFDRFSQAANQSNRNVLGTGLGLSVVKAIVEGHQGSVSLQSEIGVGTIVSVVLPKPGNMQGDAGVKIASHG